MKKKDLRTLNKDERYALKTQVVLLKQLGKHGAEIEELTGVNESTASRIWQSFLSEGTNGLKNAKSGRKPGEKTLLSPDEERGIRRAIIDHAPDQLKLAGMLWTRQKVSDYIKREHGKTVPLRSVTNYLKAWGLTCQRPTKRAYAQDDVRVKSFQEKEYPVIAARAKAENADIYWGDETGVSNTANYERGFSLRGQPPVLKVETKRERVSMISAITGRGSVRFMLYETMTQQTLMDFMRRLVTDAPRKVFLILDNLRVHHGKIVAQWLEKNKERIEVFFLPPYAPELNPVEYLNHALKVDVHSGKHPRRKSDLIHKVHSFMRRLQHRKEQVRAFFMHKRLAFLGCCC
jgi:transposase